MRRAVLGLITLVALCLAGQAPAGAASKPGGVGLVSYVAATKSSLTVSWNKASSATKYQVFVSTSYSGVSSASVFGTTTSLHFTAKGLKSGTNYFIQVRAMNGSTAGSRSSRVGHRTIRAQGTATGPYYKVMTYNLCTRACMESNTPGDAGYYTYWKWSTRMPYAVERIESHAAGVVMLQEAECEAATDRPKIMPPAGYASIFCRSAKQMYFNDARFDLAPGEECRTVDDPFPFNNPAAPEDCTSGSIFLGTHGGGNRFAIWAELIDRAAGNKRTLFVNAHLVAGSTGERVAERKVESYKLIDEIRKINTEGLPVVYGGDFNSHKGRTTDSVAAAFNTRGYHDAFDLAMKLKYQHHNSYNAFQSSPILGIKWGDHVDHFWVNPGKTRVTSWANGARLVGGKYPHPIPSDHNPVVVSVQVN